MPLLASLLLLALPKPPMRILFVGNSHTQYNNLAVMVEKSLESDGSGRQVEVDQVVGAMLNGHFQNEATKKRVAEPMWDAVVLQGAMMSSSHQYVYRQDGAIGLAKLAKKAGSRVILFAEWPRKGWEETEWVIEHYRTIAKEAGVGEVAPVGRAWDVVRAKRPKLQLWNPDGNHAEEPGSFIAAETIYFRMTRGIGTPSYRPPSMDAETAALIREAARAVVRASMNPAAKAARADRRSGP